VVIVIYSGTVEPSGTIVVAPLAATGEWRVWLATAAWPTLAKIERFRIAGHQSTGSGTEPLAGGDNADRDRGRSRSSR
jgi:hypothetical protein